MQQDESPVRGKLRKALFKKLVGKGVLDPTVHAASRSEVCPYVQACVCMFLQNFRTFLHSLRLSPVERPILLALTSPFPTKYLLLHSKSQYPPCHQAHSYLERRAPKTAGATTIVFATSRGAAPGPCRSPHQGLIDLDQTTAHTPSKHTFSCIHT